VDTIAGSVVKRLAHGRTDGVVVLAEGLAEIVPADDIADRATPNATSTAICGWTR